MRLIAPSLLAEQLLVRFSHEWSISEQDAETPESYREQYSNCQTAPAGTGPTASDQYPWSS